MYNEQIMDKVNGFVHNIYYRHKIQNQKNKKFNIYSNILCKCNRNVIINYESYPCMNEFEMINIGTVKHISYLG